MKKYEKRIINGVEKLVVVEVVETIIEELDSKILHNRIEEAIAIADSYEKEIEDLEKQIENLSTKRQLKLDEITINEDYLKQLETNDVVVDSANVTIENGVKVEEEAVQVERPAPVFGRNQRQNTVFRRN